MKFAVELNKHINKFAHTVEPNKSDLSFQIVTLESEHEENFFTKLRQNDLFSLLNLVPTKFQKGEALGLQQTMAGNTDTSIHERIPKAAANQKEYFCQQMNVDSFISYQKLDNFLAEPNFTEAFESYLDKHLLASVLMVGFHGERRANTSNVDQNPLGQDVQKGWLQKIRDHATQNGGQGVLNVGEIGENGTYKTLGKAVKAGLAKVKPIYQDSDFIAICGRDVIEDGAIENNKDGLEGQFITRLQKLVGGCKAITLPHFPANAILLTRLDNLSLYVHRNNVRRGFFDEPRTDSLIHYFSFNVDFVVEDFNGCALLENIELAE